MMVENIYEFLLIVIIVLISGISSVFSFLFIIALNGWTLKHKPIKYKK